MLDEFPTSSNPSPELQTLVSRLYYTNLYLDKAMPDARREHAKGNLTLDYFMTGCGTMGCVLFHFANHADLLPLLRIHGSECCDKAEVMMFGIDKWSLHLDPVTGDNMPLLTAFAGQNTSLNERERYMKIHKRQLQEQIAALSIGVAA